MNPAIVIRISELHPAIVNALPGRDTDKVREEINAAYAEQDGVDSSGKVTSRAGKERTSFTLAAKCTAKLPKGPLALLAEVHWYLVKSGEYFTRVESVVLPMSVMDWAKAKRFDPAPVSPEPTSAS